MQGLLGEIFNSIDSRRIQTRTPWKLRILAHPSPPARARRDSETIITRAGRFPSDVDLVELIPTVVRASAIIARPDHNAGSTMYFAALDTLSIHSRDTAASEVVGDWPWSPGSATPLQPPPRYLLALAFITEPQPESAAGFATLAIYEENIARSRIKRPIKIEGSDRVKIDSAGSIPAPPFHPADEQHERVARLQISNHAYH